MQPKYIAVSLMGLIVGLAFVASGAFYANQPSEGKQDKIHVLPLVEEMATANPLQF
jgi:hypothetical protein